MKVLRFCRGVFFPKYWIIIKEKIGKKISFRHWHCAPGKTDFRSFGPWIVRKIMIFKNSISLLK